MVASFFLVLTIFLQIGLGYDVLTAGLTSIPFSLGIGITVALAQGVLVPRFGRNMLTAGPLIMAVGFGLFMAEIAVFGGALSPWAIAPVLFVTGAGMGCVVAPIYPFILAQVPVADAGSASGVINAVGQVGGAIGVAAVGVVFFGLLGSQATVSVDSVRGALSAELTAAGLPEFAVPQVVAAFETCFHDRANAKDFSDVPAELRGGRKGPGRFRRLRSGAGRQGRRHRRPPRADGLAAQFLRRHDADAGLAGGGAAHGLPAHLPAAAAAEAARGAGRGRHRAVAPRRRRRPSQRGFRPPPTCRSRRCPVASPA